MLVTRQQQRRRQQQQNSRSFLYDVTKNKKKTQKNANGKRRNKAAATTISANLGPYHREYRNMRGQRSRTCGRHVSEQRAWAQEGVGGAFSGHEVCGQANSGPPRLWKEPCLEPQQRGDGERPPGAGCRGLLGPCVVLLRRGEIPERGGPGVPKDGDRVHERHSEAPRAAPRHARGLRCTRGHCRHEL